MPLQNRLVSSLFLRVKLEAYEPIILALFCMTSTKHQADDDSSHHFHPSEADTRRNRETNHNVDMMAHELDNMIANDAKSWFAHTVFSV